MISKYMVLVESEQKLLVMRLYQIYAVKALSIALTKTEEADLYGILRAAAKPSPLSKPPPYTLSAITCRIKSVREIMV